MSAASRGAERVEADNYPTPSWAVRRLLEACDLPLEIVAELRAVAEMHLPLQKRAARWLEPAAGDGAIVLAVNKFCATHHGLLPHWHQNELRADTGRQVTVPRSTHLGRTTSDYLARPFPGFDVIITNPPFSLAAQFAAKAVREAPHVALLLRLNWLSGDARAEWLRANPPDVYVLPNRPSFAASLSCKGLPASKRLNREAREACAWQETIQLAELAARRAASPLRCPTCDGHVLCTTSDATEYAWFVWGPNRGKDHGELRVLAPTSEEERKAG